MAVITNVSPASNSGIRQVDRAARGRYRLRQAVLAAFVSACSFGAIPQAPAGDLFVKLRANSARKAETMTLEDLAALVDEIDRELQRKGRVMVKQPDVWGQNRLTSQRGRYNNLMQAEEANFELLLNTYVGTVDNAAFTYEMRARQQFPGVGNDGKPAEGDLKTPKDMTKESDINIQVNSAESLANPSTGSSPDSAISNANSLKLANRAAATGIGLEPTIRIDEKSRYIQHVQQLLRNNTGDDKTDMPGYGLYLVRMPVSVMPGSNTMRDNGAVVTAEIKHNLTGDLLRQMMRTVVLREATFNMSNMLRDYDLNPSNAILNANVAPAGRLASAPAAQAPAKMVPGVSFPLHELPNETQGFVRDNLIDGGQIPTVDQISAVQKVLNSASDKSLEITPNDLGLLMELKKNLKGEALSQLLSLSLDTQGNLFARSIDGTIISFDFNHFNSLNRSLRILMNVAIDQMRTDHFNSRRRAQLPPYFHGLYFTDEDIQRLYEEWSGVESEQQNQKSGNGFRKHNPDMYLWFNQQFTNTVTWLEQLMKNPRNGENIKKAGNQVRQAYRIGQLGLSKSTDRSDVYDENKGGYLTLDRARANLFKQLILAINEPDLTASVKDIFNDDAKLLEEFQIDPNPIEITQETAKLRDLKKSRIPKLQIRNRFALAYSYFLYSSIVNEQLKLDMKVMAERKGHVMDEAELMDFDCFSPDDHAKSFFTDYVQAKWPIQVFSLDPAIDQQNEADSLSRRSDLQVALAQSVANGTTELNQALQYARKIEQEFATIGLNRTAVGFNAGATTFGWKFYPRFQTPPPQNNPQRIGSLILNGAPTRRYDVAQRRIEPGPRECVALVVAPNFVPSLRMTTTTNWFDLTPNMHHGNEKISNADMIRLGRQITMARHAFQRLCDDGHYRPGDIERLQDRITQLENMLPTQTMDIQLPFEGDWYGMELFASDGARLAPKLFMWYGEPALPSTVKVKRELGPDMSTIKATYEEGTIRSVFLIGQGFSIAETKVIVGGVPVPSEFVELMSRNVLRIQIPTDAASIKIEGEKPREVIDVHVATPNGVSNHLYVDTKSEKPKSQPSEVPNFGMSVDADKSTVTAVINVRRGPDGQYRYVSREIDNDSVLKIKVADPAGLAATEYSLTLQFKNRKPLTDIRATFNNKGEFIVNAREIGTIFDYIDSFSPDSVIPGFDPNVEKTPDFQTLTTGILAQPSKLDQRDAILSSLRLKIDGSFTFNFELMIAPQSTKAETTPTNQTETGEVRTPASPPSPAPTMSPSSMQSLPIPQQPVAPSPSDQARAVRATPTQIPENLRLTQENVRSESGTSNQRKSIHPESTIVRGNTNQPSIDDLPPALTSPSNEILEMTEPGRGAETDKASVSGTNIPPAPNSPFGVRDGKETILHQGYSADQRTASQKTGIPLPR